MVAPGLASRHDGRTCFHGLVEAGTASPEFGSELGHQIEGRHSPGGLESGPTAICGAVEAVAYELSLDVMGPGIYAFGPFLLDIRERRLLRDGEVVPLTLKAF